MNGPRIAGPAVGDDWGDDAPTAVAPLLVPLPEQVSSAPAPVHNILAPELSTPTVRTPARPLPQLSETSAGPALDDWGPIDESGLEDGGEGGEPSPSSATSRLTRQPRRSGGSGRKSAKAKKQGMRLTERDIEILTFLGRYRAATVNQIARHVDSSMYAIRNRLPRMHREGMLSWSFTGQAKPKVWTVTDTGLKVAALNLSAPTISWGTLRHTLGLVDLGTTFELAGERVVTEREIRAALRYTPTARMRTVIDLHKSLEEMQMSTDVDSHELVDAHYTLPVQGKNYSHIPDMVVVRAPFENGASGSIAVELELNRKTLSEWRNIITAYRDTANFAQAVYYVVDVEIERALRGVIHALGAEHRVSVIRFEPLDTTAMP
jgi:hypothetical protein